MNLIISVGLNIIMYVFIGILTYRLVIIVEDDNKTIPSTEYEHYKSFIKFMSCIWPIFFFLIYFQDTKEQQRPPSE